MSFAEFFTWLYPVVPTIAVMGYIPQVWHLIHFKDRAQHFTLSTWYLWCLASVVATGYGFFVAHDAMITIASATHFVFQSIVISLVLYRRHEAGLRLQTIKTPQVF